jgi:hypothetical protein
MRKAPWMERSSNSIEFERAWGCLREDKQLVPLRSNLNPADFEEFLPLMAIAVFDLEAGTTIVRLAATRIREIFGFELTGMDFNKFGSAGADMSIDRRRGYHVFSYGRCEQMDVNFAGGIVIKCELTNLPLWSDSDERLLIVLLTPLIAPKHLHDEEGDVLVESFSAEVFIDLGGGLPVD